MAIVVVTPILCHHDHNTFHSGHEPQGVRTYQGWDDNRPHDLNTAALFIQRTQFQAHPIYRPFLYVPELPHHHASHDLPSIMVARFEPLWVSYWQAGGMALSGSTATVSGTSYTSCSAGHVSGCTCGPPTAYSETMWLSCQSLGYGSHLYCTLIFSALLHSPTHHTHPCGWMLRHSMSGE